MNNLPAGLIAGTAANSGAMPDGVRSAIAIGIDLGPNLSVTGSLADDPVAGRTPARGRARVGVAVPARGGGGDAARAAGGAAAGLTTRRVRPGFGDARSSRRLRAVRPATGRSTRAPAPNSPPSR